MASIVLATINAKWIHPSLALRLLKANLGGFENSCEIMEFALRQPLAEKVRPLIAARPRVLGLSVSIWNHAATSELLEALSKEWGKPDAGEKPFVVLGGPEVSWLPREAEIFRHADYVICGEGEDRFRSLCFRLLNGEKPDTPSFAPPCNVEITAITSAYHFYTDEDLQRKLTYVEASRGCAFACEFCQAGIDKTAVREFPLHTFLEDMEKLIRRGARTFKFLDRSFNLNITRAIAIAEFFLKQLQTAGEASAHGETAFCVHFEMIPSRFPPELRDVIRCFPPGSLRLEIGIQTFNAQTAALIGRTCKAEKEIEALEFLRRETNAIIHADLIAGLPGEDFASFGAGFDRLWQVLSGTHSSRFADSAASFEIQPGILKCLPGTAIVRHDTAYRMRYSPQPPYEVIETSALTEAELMRIKNFARFWELIVNRNPFPDVLPLLLPPGKPAFDRFMFLSDRLLELFGKNWGIDRQELRNAFVTFAVPHLPKLP